MATATKKHLSEDADGGGILIAATGSPGTDVHDADANLEDEVWLFASNEDAADVVLTVEWGSREIIQTIPAQSGLVTVIPGQPVTSSLAIAAYSSVANDVTVFGFVNQITN